MKKVIVECEVSSDSKYCTEDSGTKGPWKYCHFYDSYDSAFCILFGKQILWDDEGPVKCEQCLLL